MPLTLEGPTPINVAQLGRVRERRARRGTIRDRGKHIEIGLVNNMPDAALQATERQFSSLLEAASGRLDVRLRLYALREIPRSEEARATLIRNYGDIAQLRARRIDALIVTGAEPIAPELAQEPYWSALAELIDWADANTVSTILSCLAAHVGVLHLDGVARQPLPEKCSGIFAFKTATQHKLVAELGAEMLTPHSRRNGLDARELAQRDYQVLSHGADVGVDMFVKQRQSLFVFLQGHPEYEDDSLAREYRRDMSRFLRSERDAPPAVPTAYYPAPVERALADFTERARREPSPELMTEFPNAAAIGPDAMLWRKSAIQFYRNWLDVIVESKAGQFDETPMRARWGG